MGCGAVDVGHYSPNCSHVVVDKTVFVSRFSCHCFSSYNFDVLTLCYYMFAPTIYFLYNWNVILFLHCNYTVRRMIPYVLLLEMTAKHLSRLYGFIIVLMSECPLSLLLWVFYPLFLTLICLIILQSYHSFCPFLLFFRI